MRVLQRLCASQKRVPTRGERHQRWTPPVCWSKPGRTKCFQSSEDGSVQILTDSQDLSRSGGRFWQVSGLGYEVEFVSLKCASVSKSCLYGVGLLGMIEIAIATVADLYEDNGGIPSSLQFPNLDDVKADVNKVSAGGLKPGQAVIINSSTLNQASALPGFAVPGMKKTFGLTGVVKNVDKVRYL